MALKVNKKISPYNHYDGRSSKIKYIVIHWVGSASSAKNNVDYFYKADRGASAHYFVDDKEIWQSVYEKDTAWAVGGGPLDQASPYAKYGKKYFKKCTNSNSISIEMCCKKKNGKLVITDETIELTGRLVRAIMKRLDIPAENVIRHFDVNGKLCLPLDTTELLTPNGWKKLQEISVGEEVAQYEKDSGEITFEKVLNVVEPYEATVLKNRAFEATPDHRMLVKTYGANIKTKPFKEKKWIDLLPNEKIKRRQGYIPVFGHYKGKGLELTDEELRFLVWIQGDGYYMKKDGYYYGLEFHLKKERKITRLTDLLNDLNIEYSISKKSDGSVAIRVYKMKYVDWAETYLDNKKFTYDFLEMNDHQFEIFWEELLHVDGCKSGDLYTSKEQQNLDVVQAICATKGKRTNKCTLGTEEPTAVLEAKSNYSIGSGEVLERKTMVGCVTVPSGFILIRQGGRPFITGNCPGTAIEPLDWDKLKSKLLGNYFKVRTKGNLIAREEADLSSEQTRRLESDKVYGIIETAIVGTATERGRTVRGDWISLADKYVERL